MSRKRKPNSRSPRLSKLEEARRAAAKAQARAQRNPTHENLTVAFALAAAVKLVEGIIAEESA